MSTGLKLGLGFLPPALQHFSFKFKSLSIQGPQEKRLLFGSLVYAGWRIIIRQAMKKQTAILTLLVFISTQLFAWGPKGHKVVGAVAQSHLTEAARHNLQALLGDTSLASIATWADEVRGNRPETFGWHFVDIPKASGSFSQARDCYRPDEKYPSSKEDHHNCIVDRISMFKQVLGDPNASQADRVEALKFLVHFVGDIHQPLHAVEEGRGGNDIHVVEFGSPQCGKGRCNFHFVWDTALIEHTGLSEEAYVARLEQLITARTLQSQATGTPEEWANESYRWAQKVWLNEGGSVDEAYYQANIGIVDERLALAGLRLAALLNEVLGQAPEKPSIKSPS